MNIYIYILDRTYFRWLKYVLLLVWFQQHKALLPAGIAHCFSTRPMVIYCW